MFYLYMMRFDTSRHVLDYRVHSERAFFMYTIFWRFVHDMESIVHDINLAFLASLSVADPVLKTFLSQSLSAFPISFPRYL